MICSLRKLIAWFVAAMLLIFSFGRIHTEWTGSIRHDGIGEDARPPISDANDPPD